MNARGRALLVAALVACTRPQVNESPRPATSDATATPVDAGDAAAGPDENGATYLGRVKAAPMSHLGADWLDRKGRDDVQRPTHVLDVVGVREGMNVADVGCGSGYFTVHLARRVGPKGKVFATDLQPEMLALLAKKTAAEKLANVTPVLATADDAKLPRRGGDAGPGLDVILLVDVYHELPKPTTTLAQFATALARDGKLVLVEYRAEDPKVAIKPEHKMTLAQIQKELAANGWTFVSSDESLPEQRIVTFRR